LFLPINRARDDGVREIATLLPVARNDDKVLRITGKEVITNHMQPCLLLLCKNYHKFILPMMNMAIERPQVTAHSIKFIC
jgi:hypothetical protein